MKITTFAVTLPAGVSLEHLYETFLAHDTLLQYHRALAKNDIFAYGPFEEASPKEVEEECGEGSAAGGATDVCDPALPFFRRKASVLMPLAAPRPLQMALGTSVIKLRLRQSVAVLRRAKVIDDIVDVGGGEQQRQNRADASDDSQIAAALAPLDLIEFRSAPRLWIPDAKDLALGKISLVASYEDIIDEREGGDENGDLTTAAAVVAPSVTPFHLSPRRSRSRSASFAGGEANSSPPQIPRHRIRIDVTATADFQPEGWMATFKRPLESVMLSMVVKSAKSMANWFAACAACKAGVGPLHPDFSKMPELVQPRLPRELSYLETRRLSVDGPPGISRGLTIAEAEEMQGIAARGSERASAVAAAAAAALVAAEVAAENSSNRGAAVPAASAAASAPAPKAAAAAAAAAFKEPVTPDRDVGTNPLTRVSLASSVESFHSAASELEGVSLSSESEVDGGGEESESGNAAAAAAKEKKSSPPSSSSPPPPLFGAAQQPATPARGARPDGRVTVSLTPSSSSKRVLRMPRWLVPGGGGSGGSGAPPRRSRSSASLSESADASAPSSSASSSSRPRSAPGGSFNEREQQQKIQQHPARRPVLAWLRPKSART